MREIAKLGASTLAAVLALSASAAAGPPLGPPPGGLSRGPSPQPPAAPGLIGLPAPQSADVDAELRQAVRDGYQDMFPSMSIAEADRRIDLQARVHDFNGRLFGRLGTQVSQTWFDNAAGRFVVVLGPNGSEREARAALLDLFELRDAEAEIRRGELDADELDALRQRTAERLEGVSAGHVRVGMGSAEGVQITVARKATERERELVAAVAASPSVHVTYSNRDDLGIPATTCGSVWNGSRNLRYCTNLRGGSTFTTPASAGQDGCTLGWWAGFPGSNDYSPYILTAGHCLTGGGQWWASCAWPNTTSCPVAGYQCCGWYGGDNGVLVVTANPIWYRDAGWTDWRNNGRHPILRTNFYPAVGEWMCHGGARTGFSCGVISDNHYTWSIPGLGVTVSDMLFSDQLGYPCTQPGDSGGPVFTLDGDGAVGTVAGGSCGQPELGYTLVVEPIRRYYEQYGLLPYGG